MTDWEGIDEFVAVADHGSFTAAAKRLGCSSSHISRQVALLEDRLQARLFDRTTRRVHLTEIGQVFHGRCLRLIEDRDEAIASLGSLQQEPTGLLRMTCAVSYGERFVVPLVNDFIERYPRLQVDIQLTNQSRDLIQDGLDLAIRLGHLTPSRLIATRLAPRAMYLCAAPTYLERYGTPHSLSELRTHRCLIGTTDQWVFQVDGGDWLFRPQGPWRCNSGTAILDAAQRGFGLCQLPDYYVLTALAEGRLVSLLPEHQPPHTAVWAVYPERRHVAAKVRMMVDHLREGLRTD
jgi:DNA-binding transcriptional LysR family regulator